MSLFYSIFLCLFVYGVDRIPVTAERLNNCSAVVQVADEYKTDPLIVASVMVSESTGINPTPKYKKSPRGPMQITAYWCENQTYEDCDFIRSGVRALVLLRRCSKIDWPSLTCLQERTVKRSWEESLCIYNQNRTCSSSKKANGYSRHIIYRTKRIRKAISRSTL